MDFSELEKSLINMRRGLDVLRHNNVSCGCSVTRQQAVEGLVKSIRQAYDTADRILKLIKGKAGDYPLYSRNGQKIDDIDYTFFSTYRNIVGLQIILNQTGDIARSFK